MTDPIVAPITITEDEIATSTPEQIQQLINKRAEHDEAMRMQALAIGAQIAVTQPQWATCSTEAAETEMRNWARWAYREATGREW